MKKGFTLAEMLVALGVVGIIAVLLLPRLIADYRLFVLENQFKRYWPEMNQALKLAYEDEKTKAVIKKLGASGWGIINGNWQLGVYGAEVNRAIAKHLSGAQPYNGQPSEVSYSFPKNKITLDQKYTSGAFATRSGLVYNAYAAGTSTKYAENMGKVVGMMWIFFDTNGIKKGPNRDGYDRFCIGINPQSGHIDACVPVDPTIGINSLGGGANYHAWSCYEQGNWGLNCAYYASTDIYPQYSGAKNKRYWKNLKL